tara:strand:+ start:1503 stop:2396 length:894 start_codon:yes stop_codon:yes gene_type:complete
MKKLAVIVCGWHYPDYFYKQFPSQKIPSDWEVDYFCISHRNPKHAVGEKNVNKCSEKETLSYLDWFFYKNIATIESIEKYGWKYIEKPNTMGDWGVFNQWIEDYDYRDYDMLFLAGDDNLVINDSLLDYVLGNKFKTIFSNGDVGKYSGGDTDPQVLEYKDDWLVLANNCPQGRGMLRGSFDFFKPEIFDMLGGKFDFSGCDMEARLDNKETPTKHFESVSMSWNNQCVQFMKFIEDNKLYPRIKFLSPYYRVSEFCIEGERGYLKNRNASGDSYMRGINYLKSNGMLDNILEEAKK